MRIQTHIEASGAVTLTISGTFNAAGVADLESALERARRLKRPVFLDLTHIRLIDRPTLKYLIDLLQRDVRLITCPAYIERWMARASESDESIE
jgi:hypothetical protein